MTFGDPPATPPDSNRLQPPLQPPGTGTGGPRDGPRTGRGVWLALTILALLVLGVVFLLPQQVAEKVPPPASVPLSAPPVAQPAGDQDNARRQAEQTLQQYLRLQAEVRLIRGDEWATVAWDAAARHATTGDRLFGERRFDEAGEAYAQALARLEALKASRSSRLQQALEAGRQALNKNDSAGAQRDFEQALLIEPDNQAAAAALARARVRDQVLELTASAGRAEEAREFETARTAYQAALRLDPAFSPAQSGLTHIQDILDNRAIKAAMSEALAAIDARRFDAAAQALDKAAAVDPQATAVADARERLRVARREAAIAALRQDAAGRAKAEDWQGAIQRYEKVLHIDERAGFAREGLARARQRARLNGQFDHYLDDPTRLYADDPLANAERLLGEVPAAPANEPKLAAKIEKLQSLVRAARQPLPVKLRSDGETEVLIYHVGRLGRFVDRQEELRPGTYTAVGSRPGYRDVRRVFTLRPGTPAPVVDIRCEETV